MWALSVQPVPCLPRGSRVPAGRLPSTFRLPSSPPLIRTGISIRSVCLLVCYPVVTNPPTLLLFFFFLSLLRFCFCFCFPLLTLRNTAGGRNTFEKSGLLRLASFCMQCTTLLTDCTRSLHLSLSVCLSLCLPVCVFPFSISLSFASSTSSGFPLCPSAFPESLFCYLPEVCLILFFPEHTPSLSLPLSRLLQAISASAA